MPPNIQLKEIPFGCPVDDPDETCIYTNGHVDPAEFLTAVRKFAPSDVPDDARAALTVADVEHIRFRPMSPSEARGHGVDFGVFETTEGGYPVTAVKL